MSSNLETPVRLGLPSKFKRWRKVSNNSSQLDVAMKIVTSDKRFLLLGAPTGSGKTVINISTALIDSSRFLYLVYSNALLNQVNSEFSSIVEPIKGRDNYECLEESQPGRYKSCRNAPCFNCELKISGCTYFDLLRSAKDSTVGVLTNFAYRGSGLKYQDSSLGKFDLLIIDEAHNLLPWLGDFSSFKFNFRAFRLLVNFELPNLDDDVERWTSWAIEAHSKVREKYANALPGSDIINLGSDLRRLSLIKDFSNWVVDHNYTGMSITPIDPRRYLEKYVYNFVDRILLSSASLSNIEASSFIPQSKKSNGFEFFDGGDGFEVKRRPVISIPTIIVKRGMRQSEENRWLMTIENLIGQRLEKRGIIDTVSFKRAELIYSRSQFKEYIILHRRSDNLVKLIDIFLNTKPPVIIISPSLNEGFDFKYDAARWLIVTKVPWLNPNSSIVKARIKLYQSMSPKRDYMVEQAALGVFQRAGRLVRAPNDWGETLVVDDCWFKWVSKSPILPRSFKLACETYYGRKLPVPLFKTIGD